MNQIVNRLAAAAVGTMLALASLGTALAQDAFPTKPIRIVVPYSAGGVADTFSRAVGQHLQAALGQPVIVENKAGGSQMIGAMDVVNAPADGYTLFLGSTTSLAVNAYTQKAIIRYDPIKDLTPISLAMRMPLFLVVNPSVPAHSVKDLIGLLKASPDKYTFASIGPGSSTHMAGERFMLQTGTKMVHVPYKSSMGAINAVIAGHVDINFDVGSTSLPLIRDGKLRALGVGSLQRVPVMPDLPTIAESVPGYEATVWFAFVMRAGTPQPIVDKLSREINRILRLPEMQAKFTPLAIELAPSTPQQLGDLIKSEIVYWAKTLKDAGIKPQ